MFGEEMIAPCGLNCGICGRALYGDKPCGGCTGPDDNKSEFCISGCRAVSCELRKTLPDRFCDSCPQYPCDEIMEKETRYANAYPLVESPIGNLACIRKEGMDSYLAREAERWTCPKCGGVICVHQGECSSCGAKFTVRTHKKQTRTDCGCCGHSI